MTSNYDDMAALTWLASYFIKTSTHFSSFFWEAICKAFMDTIVRYNRSGLDVDRGAIEKFLSYFKS